MENFTVRGGVCVFDKEVDLRKDCGGGGGGGMASDQIVTILSVCVSPPDNPVENFYYQFITAAHCP
jgi:hypothetical protein